MECLRRITLLSSSARRREIIGKTFDCVSIECSRGAEPRPESLETARGYVIRSAVAKLGPLPWNAAEGFLISADTVVVLDGEILGKPTSKYEARSMLENLSDAWHEVITGVAILDSSTGRLSTDTEASLVRTRPFNGREIEDYISGPEPYDKAGAYAVQDDKFKPVMLTRGCYLNIVGLPLCLVVALLKRHSSAAELRDLSSIPYYGRCTDCKLGNVVESAP